MTAVFLPVYAPFASGEALAAAPRESWLAFERKGTAFGYEHLKAGAPDDKTIEYRVERAFKVDVVGMSQQDIKENATLITDKNLNPLSFIYTGSYKVKSEKITGAVEGGKLNVTYDDECGTVSKKTFDAAGLYFDLCLADILLSRASEKAFSVNIFDMRYIRRVDVRVLKNEGTIEAEVSVEGNMPENVIIDPQGGVISSTRAVETLNGAGGKTYRTDEKIKDKIAVVPNDDTDLTVEIDKPLGNMKKIKTAKIAVRWMNIPLQDFVLTDNRQKVVAEKYENGIYEVALELSRIDAGALPSGAVEPASDMQKYIGETEFITPADTAVVELANKLAAGESDAVKIVDNILKWVNVNIKTDFIAETLSAPQVLKKKRGKCSENAILFAALARALKIPAKLSLGVTNAGGRWMGHMWNEVYIGGKWIAVDASPGEFVSGASHIKFIDSDTVNGTQNVRIKLIDNLGISVIDFESEKAPAGVKTGLAANIYTNAEYGCRISLPASGWKLSEEKKGDIATVTAKPDGADGVDFALVIFSAPGNMSAKTIIDGRLSALASMLEDYKKISEGAVKISGLEGVRVRFVHKAGKKNVINLVNENTMLAYEGAGYLLACLAPEGEFEKYEKEFEKIIASFELL
jgi:transglutaminase-like putative cysteine protease